MLLRTGWAALRGDTDTAVANSEAALESKGESELRAKAEAKAARLKALLARSQAIAQRLREVHDTPRLVWIFAQLYLYSKLKPGLLLL